MVCFTGWIHAISLFFLSMLFCFLTTTITARIGGTVSLINTGAKDIFPNNPIYWDVPEVDGQAPANTENSECGPIKGHPENIIYPATRMLDLTSELDELVATGGVRGEIKKVLEKRRRIIGWSLNYAKPGEQLDLLLRR